jgi:hypothetical protein
VTITVNGKKMHDGIVKRSMDVLIEEAHKRHDSSMLYTAFVDVKLK